MKITLDQFRAEDLFENDNTDNVELFEKHFGQSVTITKICCLQYASIFDFNHTWWGFLSDRAQGIFREKVFTASAVYEEARAPADLTFKEDTALICAAYNEIRAVYERGIVNIPQAATVYRKAESVAYVAYKEAEKPFRMVRNKTVAPLRKTYNKTVAVAFWKASKIK